MLETWIRPVYQKICVDPVVYIINRTSSLSANMLTLAALVFGVVCAFFIAMDAKIPAIVFLLLSGYCDTLDGSVARKRGTQSDKGAIFDIVADRLVESAIVLGFYFADTSDNAVYCLLIIISFYLCVTSFLIVSMFLQNHSEKSFAYSKGLIERAEAFVFFIVMIIFPQYFDVIALVLSALVILSAVLHIRNFIKATG